MSSRPPRTMTPEEQAAVARFRPEPSPLGMLWYWGVYYSSRLLMRWFNRVEVERRERFEAAQATGRGLLTFSNHVCLFDDPWLTACFTDGRWEGIRWIAADAKNFFGKPIRAYFFSAGKCVPVVRGGGLDQPGMDFLIARLQAGDWVHVFPEGGRTRDPEQWLRLPFKPGFARMVQEARPLLLPFYHQGMQRILPIGAGVPRVGHAARLIFGEVTDSSEGLADADRGEITAWAETALGELEHGWRGPSPAARAGT